MGHSPTLESLSLSLILSLVASVESPAAKWDLWNLFNFLSGDGAKASGHALGPIYAKFQIHPPVRLTGSKILLCCKFNQETDMTGGLCREACYWGTGGDRAG